MTTLTLWTPYSIWRPFRCNYMATSNGARSSCWYPYRTQPSSSPIKLPSDIRCCAQFWAPQFPRSTHSLATQPSCRGSAALLAHVQWPRASRILGSTVSPWVIPLVTRQFLTLWIIHLPCVTIHMSITALQRNQMPTPFVVPNLSSFWTIISNQPTDDNT